MFPFNSLQNERRFCANCIIQFAIRPILSLAYLRILFLLPYEKRFQCQKRNKFGDIYNLLLTGFSQFMISLSREYVRCHLSLYAASQLTSHRDGELASDHGQLDIPPFTSLVYAYNLQVYNWNQLPCSRMQQLTVMDELFSNGELGQTGKRRIFSYSFNRFDIWTEILTSEGVVFRVYDGILY